jgi:hypothetical protein
MYAKMHAKEKGTGLLMQKLLKNLACKKIKDRGKGRGCEKKSIF